MAFLTRRTPLSSSWLRLEALEVRDCPASYTMIDLLPGAGMTSSQAHGVNDNGLVTGYVSGTSPNRAAVWQTGTAATASPVLLPAPVGSTATFAADANNSNVVAGSIDQAGIGQATLWLPAGSNWVSLGLGTLGTGFLSSSANGLSDKDANNVTWVAGDSWTSGSSPVLHAAIWRVDSSGSVLSRINLEPALMMDSTARDVRVSGSTVYVAGEVSTTGGTIARRWTLDPNGTVTSREDLGTLGGPTSDSSAINSQGDVVGSSRPLNGPVQGFIELNGSMIGVGSLGNNGSRAYGINDADVVVGNYSTLNRKTNQATKSAFVWQGGVMTDLLSQIVGTRSWNSTSVALDVNNGGSVVGSGQVKVGKSSQEHGFLARPAAALHATHAGDGSTAMISERDLRGLLPEAIQRWQGGGVDPSSHCTVKIRIADLGGTTLGLASGNTIWLDDNAAGWGWFVDPTPWDNSEFTTPGNQGEQNRIDLLSVLMHEIGHALGHEHEANGVMQETLDPGERLGLGGVFVDGSLWFLAPDLDD